MSNLYPNSRIIHKAKPPAARKSKIDSYLTFTKYDLMSLISGQPGYSLKNPVVLFVLTLGLMVRMLMAGLGQNFDMDSYLIVTDVLHHGGNVYAETTRYNYGPVWFQCLHFFDWLSGHDPKIFRYAVAGFLSLVDVGIFFVLLKTFGRLVAGLFFLNPIAVLITGFQSQFDNFAILLALAAMLLIGDDFEKPIGRRKLWGLLLLGLSLATKHLFFAFPFWLAIKQKGMLQKFLVGLIPVAVFLAGFAPYWSVGKTGIVQNVFHYHSTTRDFFYHWAVPKLVQFDFSSQTVWLLLLGFFAFVCRRKSVVESLLLYTAALVAFCPAFANQYFAIPVAFLALRFNWLALAYTIAITLFLLVNENGLQLHLLHRVSQDIYGYMAVFSLGFCLLWSLWQTQILRLLRICLDEIRLQLGLAATINKP